MASAEKAVTKAEAAAEKRFEAVNEFRGQLSDQASQFMPRSESNVRYSALADKVDAIERRLDVMQGKSTGLSSVYGWIVGGVSLVVSIVVIVNVLTAK
jgi:hypothetical protein